MVKRTKEKILCILLITITILNFSCNDDGVDSIYLNETNKYLSIGDTLQIGYLKVEPEDKNYEITWTSTNTAVASVNENGLVTAKSVGKTVITAKSGKKSAACQINVVTYGFQNAAIFETNTPQQYYFILSKSLYGNAIEDEANENLLFIFELILPADSTNIVTGKYQPENGKKEYPYFIPGQKDPEFRGSYLVEQNDTLLITGGMFSVSTPDELYFIYGDIETTNGNRSFIYEGGIPLKIIPPEK